MKSRNNKPFLRVFRMQHAHLDLALFTIDETSHHKKSQDPAQPHCNPFLRATFLKLAERENFSKRSKQSS